MSANQKIFLLNEESEEFRNFGSFHWYLLDRCCESFEAVTRICVHTLDLGCPHDNNSSCLLVLAHICFLVGQQHWQMEPTASFAKKTNIIYSIHSGQTSPPPIP